MLDVQDSCTIGLKPLQNKIAGVTLSYVKIHMNFMCDFTFFFFFTVLCYIAIANYYVRYPV